MYPKRLHNYLKTKIIKT